MEHLVWKRGR